MRKIYFLILSMILSSATFAQQDPQFSHYFFNQLYLNPAMAGSENVTRIQAIHRSQYLGYQSTYDDGSAPTTQIVSANVPLKMIKRAILCK
jgi:type IX secretion system PorP/SprF family membrane protein